MAFDLAPRQQTTTEGGSVKPRQPTPHPYAGDGVTDPYTHLQACRCGLPRKHHRHDMPDVPADTVEAEARMLGEAGR
jgi:hypothetical protein